MSSTDIDSVVETTRIKNLAFIREVDRLISEGKTEHEIAESFGFSVSQYRIARAVVKSKVKRGNEDG